MATRIDSLNTFMDAAVAAQAAGDYATALNNAIAAQGIIASLPKAARSQGTGGGQQSAEWDVAGVQNFIKSIYRQQGASLGVQSAPISVTEPVLVSDGSQYTGATYGGWQ